MSVETSPAQVEQQLSKQPREIETKATSSKATSSSSSPVGESGEGGDDVSEEEIESNRYPGDSEKHSEISLHHNDNTANNLNNQPLEQVQEEPEQSQDEDSKEGLYTHIHINTLSHISYNSPH